MAVKLSDEQLFGKDLFINADGDLDTVSNNGFVDFKIISGRSNLQQALLNRLATDPGDLPQHKEYGSNLSELVSLGMIQAKELAFKYVSMAINDEPRIKELVSVKLVDTATNAFDLEVTVSLQDSSTPLVLVFPNFLGS